VAALAPRPSLSTDVRDQAEVSLPPHSASPAAAPDGESKPATTTDGVGGRTKRLATVGGAPTPLATVAFSPVVVHSLDVMTSLAGRLLGTQHGTRKLSGMYVVVETEEEATGDHQGVIIDCSSTKSSAQRQAFMSDWWRAHGRAASAKDGATKKATTEAGRTGSASAKVGAGTGEGNVSTGDESGPGAGGGDQAVVKTVYPALVFNNRETIKSVAEVELGKKTLSAAELQALLTSWGLRSYKQVTFGMVAAIFSKVAAVVRQHLGYMQFAWAQVCPRALLLNVWTLEGGNALTDGSCMYPPNHAKSKEQGGVEKKRFGVCVAAHVSPFWGAVLLAYFRENPVKGGAVSKRFRNPSDDAFANVNKSSMKDKRRHRLGTSKYIKKDKDSKPSSGHPAGSGKKAGVGGRVVDDGVLAAHSGISAYAHAAATKSVTDMGRMSLYPILP